MRPPPWLARLLGDNLMGTGDPAYEERFGETERRVVRRSAKLRAAPLRAFFRSAAISAREMDHWLFLNPRSPFRDRLARLDRAGGRWAFCSWTALCLCALDADVSLPDMPPDQWAAAGDFVVTHTGLPVAEWTSMVERRRSGLGSRELYQEILHEISRSFLAPPDLEETMTYGILLARMLAASDGRCRRLL